MTRTPRNWPSSAGSSAKTEGFRSSPSQRLPCVKEAVARRARRPRRAAPSPPVGRGDHTPPCWPVDQPGVPGNPGGLSTPHFLFGAPKRKRRWSRQKKKRLSLRSYGRGAPSRAAGRGSKPFCPINAAPTRTRAGPFANFRTLYAVLHSEGIGQRLNLTSCSFRAFRFAKRCPGGRGAVPLLGWSLRQFPPIPRVRGANAPLCAAGLGGCGSYPSFS